MRNAVRAGGALLLAVASLAPLGAGAQAPASAARPEARLREVERDQQKFEAAYKLGKRTASFCANCHGEGGNSVNGEVPNLAGQNTAYLFEQIRQFSDGRRKNEFMQGLMRALSIEEKVALAVYFSNQAVAPRPVQDAALVARGKAYYDRICFRCHGEQGHGSEQYARIAGQQPGYLRTTLQRYRAGSGVRTDPVMAANTRQMSDADMEAVVAYVATLK